MDNTKFYRDTWVEINLDNIHNNVKNIRNYLPEDKELITVVKANGYGHGALQVAKEALKAGANSLAVALMDEAVLLRQQGITVPILVMGASRPEDIDRAISNDITVTVFSGEWLKTAKKHKKIQKQAYVHIKLDTGMGRLGIRKREELSEFATHLDKDHFIVDGVYTHFATADNVDTAYFHKQFDIFEEMLVWLKEVGITPKKIHCGNSATTMRFKDKLFNAVRTGIITYGLTPSVDMEHLIPIEKQSAFSLHTKIAQVKKISKGDSISYGATYTADDDQWIGTLPIGYADGWVRKLQGHSVLVNGEKCQIVGRICMDQCMIKLPSEVPVGTQVTLIGSQEGAEISAEEVAAYLDTINYEIVCLIGGRVPRVYMKNGEVVEVVNQLNLA